MILNSVCIIQRAGKRSQMRIEFSQCVLTRIHGRGRGTILTYLKIWLACDNTDNEIKRRKQEGKHVIFIYNFLFTRCLHYSVSVSANAMLDQNVLPMCLRKKLTVTSLAPYESCGHKNCYVHHFKRLYSGKRKHDKYNTFSSRWPLVRIHGETYRRAWKWWNIAVPFINVGIGNTTDLWWITWTSKYSYLGCFQFLT